MLPSDLPPLGTAPQGAAPDGCDPEVMGPAGEMAAEVPQPGRLILPPRLDTDEVERLADALQTRRGAPLTLDLSETRFIGALGLQLLIAAARQWAADGAALVLEGVPDSLRRSAAWMGVDLADGALSCAGAAPRDGGATWG